MHLRKALNYRVMVINTTFNNISVIWWRSIYIDKQFNDLQKNYTESIKIKQDEPQQKTGGELRCPGRVGSSCSTSGTRRVTLVISNK